MPERHNDDRPVIARAPGDNRSTIGVFLAPSGVRTGPGRCPGDVRAISARAPFNRTIFCLQNNRPIQETSPGHRSAIGRRPSDAFLNALTPKIIAGTPGAFKLYLKLDGARPMSKISYCHRPIVPVAGRTPYDVTIFCRNRRRPAAVSYL